MALPYTRSEVKERARATWRGACNVTLPSFAADLGSLNEGGIVHDVRLAAEHGFWGTLVAGECGTTEAEYVRFMEVAAGAAPPGFRLVAHLSTDTFEESVRIAQAAEALGLEAALPAYPPSFRPASAKEIVAYTRDLSQRSGLALIVFAVETWGFKALSPAGFPLEALEEIARLDTAAAVKYEAGSPGLVSGLAEVLRRCGDHVLVENPMEQHAPGLVEWFGMQWIGTSAYESFGDRVPRWFAKLHAGGFDEAMASYWSYQPLREAKAAFHNSFGGANLIHRPGWKYLGWLHGYNGGPLRMPQMRLSPGQMKGLRGGAAASGFQVPDTDEGFFAGRVPA